MKYVLYAFCLFTLIACGSDDDSSPDEEEVIICDDSVEPAFRITVLDGADDSLLEEVIVTVIENEFSEVLIEESTGVYTGPDERTGTYLITIEKEGFQTITVTEAQIVMLTENMCHVDTIEMTFFMVAN